MSISPPLRPRPFRGPVLATLLATPLLLGPAAPAAGSGDGPAALRARAEAIHREALVVDGHNDVGTFVLDFGFDLAMDGAEPGDRSGWPWFVLPWLPGRPSGESLRTHTDLVRARRGGLDAAFFSVWASGRYYDPADPERAAARVHAMIDALERQAARHPERLGLARSAADVRRLADEGRIAMLLGLEGGHAIGESLERLRRFHARGVRYVTLTWSFTHAWADSAGDALHAPEARHGGLTDFGRDVVREMNRLGVLVDLSHVSDATFRDAIETTRAPVIASHSAARALVDHPRNLSDAMLHAVAETGGVAMIPFVTPYVDPRKAGNAALAWDWLSTAGGSETTAAHVADHVEHAVAVAGVEHVGLGSDLDGTPFLPSGLAGVEDLPKLTEELLRRGYTEAELRKILGRNVLRALAEAERVADELARGEAPRAQAASPR